MNNFRFDPPLTAKQTDEGWVYTYRYYLIRRGDGTFMISYTPPATDDDAIESYPPTPPAEAED